MRFGGGAKTASKKLDHTRRAAARRRVMPGFPITLPFKSREEVDAYLGGATITCMLCGREFKRLGIHLPKIHSVSEDEYRRAYDIPLGRGLTSAVSRERYSKATKARIDVEKLTKQLAEARPLAQAALRGKKVVRPEWVNREHEKRVLQLSGMDEKWTAADFYRVLEKIGEGRTVKEVCSMPGYPSESVWRSWCQEHPDFKREYLKIWDGLPFETQARGQRLGPRFRRELRRLWNSGLRNDHVLAPILGVTAMTTNKITRGWRKNG